MFCEETTMPNIILEKLIKYFLTIYGLLLGILTIFLLFAISNNLINDIIKNTGVKNSIHISLYVLYFIFWYILSQKIPKLKFKNDIGVIISFETENATQKERLEKDVIEQLKTLLCANNLQSYIEIIIPKNYQTKMVNKIFKGYIINKNKKYKKSYNKLIEQNKFSVYIWGELTQRNDTENKYFLNTNVISKHSEIQIPECEKLENEIMLLIPKIINFPVEQEYKGFNLTKDMLYIAIRYITGLIMYLSNEQKYIITAYNIHNGLLEELKRINNPIYNQINMQLQGIYGAELYCVSIFEHTENKNFGLALELSDLAVEYLPQNHDILYLNGYLNFEVKRNTKRALIMFDKAKHVQPNNNWGCIYSMAFIFMYLRRFEEGLKLLDFISSKSLESQIYIAQQCIDYDIKMITIEQDKVQILFVIGYLYYKVIENSIIALDYLEDFVEKASNKNNYGILNRRARKYIISINNLINNDITE